MIDLITTRLLHWKKQWKSLVFWLLFPIFSTLLIIHFVSALQEDTKVPVGLVLEEETPLALDLYEAIKEVPLIRIYPLSKRKAIDQLNKHQLDSVFVIEKGYDRNIRKGSRNRLITGYQSDLSLAYFPVQEVILSFIQQDAGRSKSAHVVRQLSNYYVDDERWSWEEIIAKSKDIQVEQQLLHSTFSFTNTEATKGTTFTLFKTWSIWALGALLSSFFLFDWLIKERRPGIMPRFTFMRLSLKSFLVQNLFIYVILLFLFDGLTLITFYLLLQEPVTLSLIGAMISYRLLISLGAFLLALLFRNTYVFYSFSLIITLLLAIGSGALLPIDGITNRYPLLVWLNPLDAFLSMKLVNVWLFICLILLAIWYMSGGKYNASRK